MKMTKLSYQELETILETTFEFSIALEDITKSDSISEMSENRIELLKFDRIVEDHLISDDSQSPERTSQKRFLNLLFNQAKNSKTGLIFYLLPYLKTHSASDRLRTFYRFLTRFCNDSRKMNYLQIKNKLKEYVLFTLRSPILAFSEEENKFDFNAFYSDINVGNFVDSALTDFEDDVGLFEEIEMKKKVLTEKEFVLCFQTKDYFFDYKRIREKFMEGV